MGDRQHKLLLLELNEINFDVVNQYLSFNKNQFSNLKILLDSGLVRTSSESLYEELEPWIQWASVHTGLTYQEHNIFRLGDAVGTDKPQIFELIEQAGFKVGSISAMNADNRLKNPVFFIPDPWTKTPSDGSFWCKSLGDAVSQAVNDNSQARITIKTAAQIIFALLRFARPKHYLRYIKYIFQSRWKPWLKPLVLDLLLHDVHWSFFKNRNPNFSTLFLNAGAHIQHHYFFNSKPVMGSITIKNPTWYIKDGADPLSEVLELYDLICGELMDRRDSELLIATGLSQKPYDRVKFYYRLIAHEKFLDQFGLSFTAVYPRMTRDFLVQFQTEIEAIEAETILKKIVIESDGLPLFGVIENRGSSLFVTLTYSSEIDETTKLVINDQVISLKPHVVFVAIKNGMHQAEGYVFCSPGFASYMPKQGAHVAEVGKSILRYFGVKH